MDDTTAFRNELNGFGARLNTSEILQGRHDADICNVKETLAEVKVSIKELDSKIDKTTSKQTWILGVAFGVMQAVSIVVLYFKAKA